MGAPPAAPRLAARRSRRGPPARSTSAAEAPSARRFAPHLGVRAAHEQPLELDRLRRECHRRRRVGGAMRRDATNSCSVLGQQQQQQQQQQEQQQRADADASRRASSSVAGSAASSRAAGAARCGHMAAVQQQCSSSAAAVQQQCSSSAAAVQQRLARHDVRLHPHWTPAVLRPAPVHPPTSVGKQFELHLRL